MLKIEYYDDGLTLIPVEQLSTYNSYYKLCKDGNGEFKIGEYYEEGEITTLEYFLASDESIDEVFKQFVYFQEITFFMNKEKKGKFARYDVNIIDKYGRIRNKRVEVLSDKREQIYDRALDLRTDKTIYLDKHYYDVRNNITYEFIYDIKTGEFTDLNIYDPLNYFDAKNYRLYPNDIGVGKNQFNVIWETFEYYRHAEPVLPESWMVKDLFS